MNPIIFSFKDDVELYYKEVDPRKFILFWNNFYDDGKYPDEHYLKAMNIGGRLEDRKLVVDGEETSSIRYLWEWKNGMPFKKHKKGLVVQRTKDRLDIFNSFREGRMSFDDFYEMTEDLTGGTVFRFYALHIARPLCYPIYDQNVIRAYRFLEKGEILQDTSKITTQNRRTLQRYLDYRSLYHDLIIDTGLDFRTVDKALWAFGGHLKGKKTLNFGAAQATSEHRRHNQ